MSTRIARAQAFTLAHPVQAPIGPATMSYPNRSCVLVRLEDGDGRVGWGETYLGPGIRELAAELATGLLGAEPRTARVLLDRLTEADADSTAVSALAIAVDDLRGRQLGLSVADLYGGARRDRVRAYASSGGYREGVEPEIGMAQDVQEAVAAGFTACKLRIGRYAPRRELPILARLRAETDDAVDLMVDANGAYALPRALEVGRELGRLGFRWYEEPLIRSRQGLSYPGYEQLAALEVTVAGGEGLRTRSAFDAFLRAGGVDIVQPDVAICGGIGELLFVADLAALRGRPCVPHAWGGVVLLAATLQALAVLPEPSELPGIDSPLLEFDRFENRMRTELGVDPIEPRDGHVTIPTGPGLGVAIDEDAVRELTVAGG